MESVEDRPYKLYMHINKFNNKKYIGITKNRPEERWLSGKGYKYNIRFYNDILKYGWDDGFEHEILLCGLTYEEACNKEIELIEKHQTRDKNKGYNIAIGGDAPFGGGIPILQYTLDGSFIREWTSATEASRETGINRENITACCNHEERRQAGGYIWVIKEGYIAETCDAYYLNRYTRTVVQYTLNGKLIKKYDSIDNASNETGIPYINIIQCCNHTQKTSGGYIWIYEDDKLDLTHHKNNLKRPVNKLSLNGDFIKQYNSVKEASVDNNIPEPNIISCCAGRQKTSHGFIWEYAYKINDNRMRKEGDVRKPVFKFDLHGNLIKEFNSLTEAANHENVPCGEMSAVCNHIGRKVTLHGFIYVFKEDYINSGLPEYKPKSRKINQYDLNRNYIQTFDSITEAVEKTDSVPKGVNAGTNIIAVCKGRQKTAYGYIWEYAEI